MESASFILSIISIVISASAIAISWMLYNKSDALYKEMRDFVVEIRTVTSKLYTDSFGLVKQSYERMIAQGVFGDGKLADDKTMQDTIAKAVHEIEGKFSSELSHLKSGDNLRKSEIEKLKSDLRKIVEEIPAKVDKSKKSIRDIVAEKVLQILKLKRGLTLEEITNDSIFNDTEKPLVSLAIFNLKEKGVLITDNPNVNSIRADEVFQL
jgi:hypothetical protein